MSYYTNGLRLHKTSAKNRGSYIYYFENGERITLRPGQDGVTEELIHKLHKLDDRECESNIDYYSTQIKNINYDPNNPKENRKTKRIWISSLEQTFSDKGNDKNNLQFDASTSNPVENVEKLLTKMLLEEIIKSEFKEKQQMIFELLEDGYKFIEIAKILGITPAAINKAKNKIKKILIPYKNFLI